MDTRFSRRIGLGAVLIVVAPALHAQQYSYQIAQSTVAIGDPLDATIQVAFAEPPGAVSFQAIVPNSAFAVDGAPQTLNGQAICQQGTVLYTPSGNETPGQVLELCRYTFRAVAATSQPVSLLSTVGGPLVQVIGGVTAPSIGYSVTPGSVIAYPANGAGPSIGVANAGGGAGHGAAATTTVTACSITGGGAAFPIASFNPAISMVGSSAPSPAAIALPACVPQGTAVTAQLSCSETRGSAAPVTRTWTLGCPAAGGGNSTAAAPPDLESEAPGGAQPDGSSITPVLSANALKLAFASDADNLASGDGNGRRDIFVRDRASGSTTRVSALAEALNPGAQEAFADPALGADGQLVAFSGSSGLVYATNAGVGQVVSSSAAGQRANGQSGRAAVIGNGPMVVFDSQATNLLPGADGNGSTADIFLKDLTSGTVTLLSLGPGGTPADGPSTAPAASADGRLVIFSSSAANLAAGAAIARAGIQQIWLTTNGGFGASNRPISINPTTGDRGNADSVPPARITPNGRYAVFESLASNLVAGDTNGVSDIFRVEIRDDRAFAMQRVSVGKLGEQSNGPSRLPAISDDGQIVTFTTDATNLVGGDVNGQPDVVFKRMDTGDVVRAPAADGSAPNGPSSGSAIAGNGSTGAFSSGASNLVPGDGNSARDIFSTRLLPAGPTDEPAIAQAVLPVPIPPNASCPAGFFIAQVGDGPGAGLTPGAFGVEVLLDQPGTRVLAGGINFGGLIDAGQVGFAGFNFANSANENQRLNLRVTGSPATSSSGSLPVRIRIARRTATTSETVFDQTVTISLASAYVNSIDLPPAFYEATVAATGGTAGGAPEGQFFFELTTSFIGRPGGGFQGGAVVGGYHAAHPFGGVSGFAAFCLATPHTLSTRVYAQPSYGPTGAKDLRLRVKDAQQQDVVVVPAG